MKVENEVKKVRVYFKVGSVEVSSKNEIVRV